MPVPPLPEVRLATSLPHHIDVVVVGLRSGDAIGVPEDIARAYAKRYGVSVAEMAAELTATSTPGATRVLPPVPAGPRLVAVGLGEEVPDSQTRAHEVMRRAAGSAIREVAGLSDGAPLKVALALQPSDAAAVRALVEGALLGGYRYQPVGSNGAASPAIGEIVVIAGKLGREGDAAARVGHVVAAAVIAAREWVNVPPNLLPPNTFAEEASAFVKDSKVSIEVLDETALAKGGYGGILAVGGGSSRPPRLARLTYAPRGAKTHLVLVGKGITFDSGGLNLKSSDGMYTMKCDMAGAASVIAATQAIAQLGLKIKVTSYAAMAENLPSATAYRPSDVLTIYGGTTVENANSDAEGRLVMADALARSAEDQPDLVIDVATLTGACVVALGDRTTGVMATDDATAQQVLTAAATAGEAMWQLPIPEEVPDKLESKVAKLRSSGDRSGGALTAAGFLREFVPEGASWAHLDIAGPAFHTGAPYGYVAPGGTGVAVRTLIALAESLQE